jgi:hypothetical protein
LNAVAQMIYPSPLNPQRYVLVVAATSAAGMHFWNAGGLWNTPLRMDWTIRDDRWVFPGDAELRAKSPLRRPAPPGFKVAVGVGRSSLLQLSG